MRLSLIGPVTPYRGGIAHFTTLLAKKLIEEGNDVQVISFKKQFPKWLYPGKSDKDLSPGRERVEASYILSPLNPISWIKTVIAIKAFHPEKLVIPWWVTFWGPAFQHIIARLKRAGIPITILIHNTIPHEARFFDRYLAKQTLKKADAFIVMTQKESNRLTSLLPTAGNINIAPLPIYNPTSTTGLDKTTLRKKLGLPVDKPILLFFGFIRPYKGLGVLINALKNLVDEGLDVDLVIVGEFWEDKVKYERMLQSLELEEHVHIFDSYIPDEEVSGFFEAADVFVAPYIDGTQSAALKIALSFGLPCVITEVIKDGITEVLPEHCKTVLVNNIKSLSLGLADMLNKPKLSTSQLEDLCAQSWQEMLTNISRNKNNER